MGGKEGQPAAICCVSLWSGAGKPQGRTLGTGAMAVRYRPRFPRFTSPPPRPIQPEGPFRDWAPREWQGARQDSKHALLPAIRGRGQDWSLVAPPIVQHLQSGPKAERTDDQGKAERDGARQNSKSGSVQHRCRTVNHRRVGVNSPPRLGNERLRSDSGPNRNVPPGVLSRWPKNPQAIGTIRWSLVAGVLEFCRATRDSLLESCRANY